MSDKHSRLAVPVAVILGCLALLIVVIVMASQSGAGETNPASGFPIVLGVLAIVALVTAVVWRSVSRRKHASRR